MVNAACNCRVSLVGKTALITGASSGIGRATSILFSKLGANLTLCGRNEESLQNTADQCKLNNVKVTTISGDLAESKAIEETIQHCMDFHNKLDVLVNNAGIIALGTLETISMEEFDHMLNVNFRSVFQLSKLALPNLIKSKGNIINVSSVNGLRSFPGSLSYGVSKAALDQFTRCTALDYAPMKVRVNAVNPGVVITELQKRGGLDDAAYAAFLEKSKTTHALGRPGHSDEVSEAIAFLASDAASFITGVTLPVDGGRHAMCPR
uniref:uncharacterized protein LOC100177165 isoform X2 n=1 Tax=Ciona intestinalis TaxID=7719 RepID=UPI000EF48B29|nr:uncharacterized protein LOC100177165 isoform X2 [Ciona intestinalis]|eukprot:XP_026690363.1 uncharacterized protein LOC100177165 isoform X2 [Ciona intestinalis]